MEYSQFIVPAIVIVVGIVLFVKMHSQSSSSAPAPIVQPAPVSAPATVAHVAAVQAEVKSLKDRIETAAAISTVARRVEDLHTRWDREDGDKKPQGQQGEKKD